MLRPFFCIFHSRNIGHTEPCRGGELPWVRTHVCRSVVFTTKKAHACTKTPPPPSPPLYRLPGQQERNLPRGMLRMKRRRGEEREAGGGRKREKGRMKERRDEAQKTTQCIKSLIQLLEGGSYRGKSLLWQTCVCVYRYYSSYLHM